MHSANEHFSYLCRVNSSLHVQLDESNLSNLVTFETKIGKARLWQLSDRKKRKPSMDLFGTMTLICPIEISLGGIADLSDNRKYHNP